MDDWDKFKETVLLPKEAFYSQVNMTGLVTEITSMLAEFGESLGSII